MDKPWDPARIATWPRWIGRYTFSGWYQMIHRLELGRENDNLPLSILELCVRTARDRTRVWTTQNLATDCLNAQEFYALYQR